MKKYFLVVVLLLLSSIFFAQKGQLKISITNIKSNEGNIKVALYNQENGEGFLKNIDGAIRKKIIMISEKKASVIFSNIPYGTYAVSLFHDENNNGEMDRASIGFPIEPYGVSGNRFVIGPPKFNDCKFKINSPIKNITIEMKSFKN